MTKPPYDQYVDKVVLEHTVFDCPHPAYIKRMFPDDLRSLLVDAWVAGLQYSNTLIDMVKVSRPFEKCNEEGPQTGMYGLLLDTDQDKIVGGKLSE